MAKYPGTVIPSKIKRGKWTYTYRQGTLEIHRVVVAEDEDRSQIFDRTTTAKTAMRDKCNLPKRFV